MDDSPLSQLLALPDLPLQKIAEHAGFRGVVNMQKTCTRFRNLFKAHPPSVNYYSITIRDAGDSIVVHYGSERYDAIGVHYKKVGNGCTVFAESREEDCKEFPDEDYKEMFLADLEKNLGLQAREQLQTPGARMFSIDTDRSTLERISTILAARSHPWRVHSMHTGNIEHLEPILPHLCLESLKDIQIGAVTLNTISVAQIEKLASFDHWKRLTRIEMFTFFDFPVEAMHHFSHLSELDLTMGERTLSHLLKLKEMILGPTFKSLTIGCIVSRDQEQIIALMGPRYCERLEKSILLPLESRTKYWFFEAPHGRGVLRVELQSTTIYTQSLVLKIIERGNVMEGAVVLPMFQFPDN